MCTNLANLFKELNQIKYFDENNETEANIKTELHSNTNDIINNNINDEDEIKEK